ncbi:MAG: hypothetical protein GY710_02820 [Desulfobacteraceae bacterium]|nr:hypothetical protein [Desulfobacteraceae bacterium]
MPDEATAAELSAAAEITMEGSGDVVVDQADENQSLFGETVPDIKDLSSEVTPASSPSLDEQDSVVLENPSQDKIVDPNKEKEVDPGEKDGGPEDGEATTQEPDAVTKLAEHKSNLEKALNESRAKNKALQFRIDQQATQQPTQVTTPTKAVDPEFTVLSKTEFEELKEESAVDAIQYMHDLQNHNDATREQRHQEDKVAKELQSTNSLIADSIEQISLAVPGVYEDAQVGQKLTDYAVEKGFDNDALSIFSNPGTMVIMPGSNKPVPLGNAAVSFVKFCNDSMAGSDTTQLRADIEKEVTAKVTNELIQKFKNNPTGVSLDEVPTAGNGVPDTWAPKSEAQLRSMSEKEKEDYYAGR